MSRLVRGDLAGAFHFNAAVVALLPVMALVWAAYAAPDRLSFGGAIRANGQRILFATFALLAAFMVVRNLPVGETWLRYPGA